MLVWTQPDGCATPIEPGGAPLISWSLIFFHGKITNGGRKYPDALMHAITTILAPLSAAVRAAI